MGDGRETTRLTRGFGDGLEDFIEALGVEAGLARNTLRSYRADLTRLARWAERRGLLDWGALSEADVVDYLAWRRSEGLTEATLAHDLTTTRMLMRHLCWAPCRLARRRRPSTARSAGRTFSSSGGSPTTTGICLRRRQ